VATEFQSFQKIARLNRDCVITEKLDGTNASIFIGEDGEFLIGSRTRWITPQDDNFGFAKWAEANRAELMTLGAGHHYGEWWGSGIQRGYGLQKGEKRFSLFNVARWANERPACCSVVPELHRGTFATLEIESCLSFLRSDGSVASPGFMKPEGIIIWHEAARQLFKVTLEKDSEPKSISPTAP
jgi:hypothetical protein